MPVVSILAAISLLIIAIYEFFVIMGHDFICAHADSFAWRLSFY